MRATRALAIAIAVGAGALGIWRGTWAVGGSDSSCYALMAEAFARGTLQPTSELARDAPWVNRSQTFAPGGFIPSPIHEDAASPVCAPGFALLLAPFYALGGADAIFLVTPLAGAVLVYLTFAFGHRVSGAAVGLAAAIVVATTPVFVFQIVQPMNDVVVAVIWMALLVVAAEGQRADRAVAMGALVGLALLVRPNLAPAAILVAAWCLANGWRSLAWCGAATAPFLIVLLLLNAALYGHPLQSGYGPVGGLFSIANISQNAQNYGRSLLTTQLGFPLIGLIAVVVAPSRQRRLVLFATAVSLAMMAVYLIYRPLPEWWYLRFLLPALAILTVLAMASVVFVAGRPLAVAPVVLILAAYTTTSSAMHDALDLTRIERRFRTAAAVARDRLPEHAVFLTVWDSGSVRYHAAREALVWDSLEPHDLDNALNWLAARGSEPYLMIEDWEEPLFRQRFAAHSMVGQLDWPPRFDIDRRVKIYDPTDREIFYRGENIVTEFVRPNGR